MYAYSVNDDRVTQSRYLGMVSYCYEHILQRHEEYSAAQEQDRLLEERQGTTRRFCCSFQLRDKTPEACVSSTAAGERGGFCCSSDTGESQTWGRERGIFRVSISKFVRFNICD